MDYSFVLVSDDKFVSILSKILKKVAKFANVNFVMNKLLLDEQQHVYVIKFIKGSSGSILELDNPDVLVVSKVFNEELLRRLTKKIKKSTYILADDEISDLLNNLLEKECINQNVIFSENKNFLIGNIMLIVSRLLSVRFNTIIKVFKTLKDEDTTSLIEAFKLVTKDARI